MSNFQEKVYQALSKIPAGRVTTYGEIAMFLGSKKYARAVGNALHKNPNPQKIFCHRVVNSKGRFAKNFGFGGQEGQKKLLQKEGVEVDENYTVSKKYFTHP